MLLLILLLISLLCFLIINGEPLRFFALRRSKLFSDLNFVQICVLDVYLGGLIFYITAMIPLGIFNRYTVIGLTVASALVTVAIHYRNIKHLGSVAKIREFFKTKKGNIAEYLAVFIMFIIFLVINLIPASAQVLGSVRDESIHSLSVQVILENNQVPLTMQPYLKEGIIYPQAAHVIFAFASYILNMEIPKVVFYTTILFKALSVLGAYFLGKKLGSGKAYSLGLSFVFAFMSSWPLSVVWGGNPFLVGFPFFLVCLGVLFSSRYFRVRHSLTELIIIAVLFGYTGAIIISYLEVLVMIVSLVLIYSVARRCAGARRSLFYSVVVFSVSLLIVGPFIFRFFAFYQYPGHNIGIPSDFAGWTSQQLYFSQALQWAYENLSPYVLLRAITILLLVGFAALLWKTKEYGNVKSAIAFALAIFTAATFLSFISFLLGGDFGIISWGHQGIIISISINILMMTFLKKLAESCRKIKSLVRVFSKEFYATTFLTIALLSLATGPFLYYRFLADPESLKGAYGMFAVTTQSDYDLMLWMKDNLTSNAVVLINQYEAGLYIPAISHHRIVVPWGASSLSRSYQKLVGLLKNNTLNVTTYQLMHHWNVSYVFVGAQAMYGTPDNPKWNPKLLLGNPNFKLVKNFDGTYLFELKDYDPYIAFLDDFEHSSWGQNGWQSGSLGKGLGNVTVTNSSEHKGSKSLQIKAQSVPTASDWVLKYAYWVSREIFVLSNSSVTLSFNLDATEGFGGNDTLAVLVSDVESGQSLVIATPNGIFKGQASAITLSAQGLFSCDLGNEWRRMFNSSLPDSFVLQFVNYDFNGIKNVAYVDNIEITSTPVD